MEEDSEDDEEEEEDEEEEDSACMKRPASKKPSASVPKAKQAATQKRPAAAVGPDGKPPVNLVAPTHYGGGRIYFSEQKYCFRKVDKVEKQIRLRSKKPQDQQAAWKSCLKAIDDDPRPQ